MIDNILLIVFITLTASFAIAYVSVLTSNIKLKKELARVTLLAEMLDKYAEIKDELDSENEVHKENFIKFLSDSRDWAFDYIENVQDGLNKFIDQVDNDIKYFDTYGDVLSTERPDYQAMKTISAAYKELIKLMPKQEEVR